MKPGLTLFKKGSPDKYAYIERTLSEEHNKVFEGKFYTFYEKK